MGKETGLRAKSGALDLPPGKNKQTNKLVYFFSRQLRNRVACMSGGHCVKMASLAPGSYGGFFFACEDFERMFDHSVPACAFFFFFFEVEISSRTLILLFMPRSSHSDSGS